MCASDVVNSLCFLGLWLPLASPHGRLIEPPSRASMWRYGFNTAPDYNDHESYCGGFKRQWGRNGGKCGICGDPWDSAKPRAHEAGGIYGQGIIVCRYKKGATFTIRVEVTANHRGHFEFRLCKHNAPHLVASQDCFDQNVLNRSKHHAENAHPAWYYVGAESKVYEMRYKLPPGITCSQCILQWRYIAANNWGRCENSSSAIGCGPQEEFRACADISIQDKDGTMDQSPYEELVSRGKEEVEEEEEEKDDEEEVVKNDLSNDAENNHSYQTVSSGRIFLPLFILLCSFFISIFIYVLLFSYYYGAKQTIKPCWQATLGYVQRPLKANKMDPDPPPPPPRTKKFNNVTVVSVG